MPCQNIWITLKCFILLNPLKYFSKAKCPKRGEGLGVPKTLELFFNSFCHIRLFKSVGRNNSVPKPNLFSEANKMKFYAVLSHFAK